MALAGLAPGIVLKTSDDIAAMRRAGALAHDTLAYALSLVGPGVSSDAIDAKVESYMRDHGAVPATLGYQGYPKSTCISVDDVICHGIPGKWRLREGQIVCIDVTVILDGRYGDTAATVPVGVVPAEATRLMTVTLEALRRGVEVVRPGARLGDIGHAIQTLVEGQGFSVVRHFVGHGIGREFHEPPQVRHFGQRGHGPALRAGMTFTIEPMVNAGDWRSQVLEDGWTAVTVDGSLSAQYEHTIAVTEDGVSILTLPEGRAGWLPPGSCASA